MKLIIDIPEHIYEHAKEGSEDSRDEFEAMRAIANGLQQRTGRWIGADVLDKIRVEIKEWYWQADKQSLAKDPCVVDAMVDLFIRTLDKYKAESEE